MVKAMKHVEGRSQRERAKIRKDLGSLKSLTVQPATRTRYEKARTRFLKHLRDAGIAIPKQKLLMDELVSDYIETLWSQGEGRALASDTLAGLQDLDPSLRHQMPQAWRLMKAWNSNEIPNRAPPFPESLLKAIVGRCLFQENHGMALSLLVGFYGLLRTGELLSIQARHVSVSADHKAAVVSLGWTKGGKRQGAAESCTITVWDVVRRLEQWVLSVPSGSYMCASPSTWRKTFNQLLADIRVTEFEFRPYSLRRGGATFWFQRHGQFDRLLVQGRWQAAKTARIYLNEGLAMLAEMRFFQSQLSAWVRLYQNALRSALPRLERASRRSTGGRGKKSKRGKKGWWLGCSGVSFSDGLKMAPERPSFFRLGGRARGGAGGGFPLSSAWREREILRPPV